MKPLEEWLKNSVETYIFEMNERVCRGSTFLGVQTVKNPLDLWCYQEILFETQPDFVVELGTYSGGSALALASFMDALGHGTVITVDIDHSHVPDRVKAHPRVKLVTGDAIGSVWKVASMTGVSSVMVIEDSSHTLENTLGVLRAYSPMVRKGHYFVVEDTVCHHGISVGPFPGPYEAVMAFLNEDPTWYSDRSREAFGITWNPKGFLKRKP